MWLVVASVVLVAGAGAVIAVITTGSHPKAAAPPTTTTAPTTTVPVGPPCPLTGQPAPGGAVPQRPALAVKVDNYPTARPQSGLDKADVVFEEPVEGRITRLVAVFQCQPADLVGPIRSAREVDVQILDELSHPLFVHVGGINQVLSLIASADDVNLDLGYHGSIIQRPAGRYPPYNTYVSTSGAWGLAPGDTTPPAPLFTYAATAPAGTPLTSIHIPYGQTSDETWSWDGSSNRWLLSYSGAPATVDNGSQIGMANVIVQTVQVSYGPWVENAEGGLEVQSQLVGSGPALVLRNGEEISGTWQRPAIGSPTSFVASDGATIPLAPGPTWVALVPSTVGVAGH